MNRWDLGDPVAMEIAMEIVPFFHVPSTGVTKWHFWFINQFMITSDQNPQQGQWAPGAPGPCHPGLQHKNMRSSSIQMYLHTLRIIDNKTNKTQQHIPYQTKQSHCIVLHCIAWDDITWCIMYCICLFAYYLSIYTYIYILNKQFICLSILSIYSLNISNLSNLVQSYLIQMGSHLGNAWSITEPLTTLVSCWFCLNLEGQLQWYSLAHPIQDARSHSPAPLRSFLTFAWE